MHSDDGPKGRKNSILIAPPPAWLLLPCPVFSLRCSLGPSPPGAYAGRSLLLPAFSFHCPVVLTRAIDCLMLAVSVCSPQLTSNPIVQLPPVTSSQARSFPCAAPYHCSGCPLTSQRSPLSGAITVVDRTIYSTRGHSLIAVHPSSIVLRLRKGCTPAPGLIQLVMACI